MCRCADGICSGHFNSRPSARGDGVSFSCLLWLSISIHAPPRGATARPRGLHFTTHSISIHAPPRGATRRSTIRTWSPYLQFQFTPLREGRPALWQTCAGNHVISIHAPPRGATLAGCQNLVLRISIHAPPRGATHSAGRSTAPKAFQFTPLREGRRLIFQFVINLLDFNSRPSARGDPDGGVARRNRRVISIHAPPRGATCKREGRGESRGISIHAPPRGATMRYSFGLSFPSAFQFTPLREGRRGVKCIVCSQQISIHAPPRGATMRFTAILKSADFNSRPSARGDFFGCRVLVRFIHFNSRPSARGDVMDATASSRFLIFQFTPLREGRRRPPRIRFSPSGRFQFTPLREGRLDGVHIGAVHLVISIHAPPRGATIVTVLFSSVGWLFQFTPLREGRRPARSSSAGRLSYFNSRPSARGDFTMASVSYLPSISIHAPPRGATARRRAPLPPTAHFNSRPSARGDCRRAACPSRRRQFQFTPLREGRLRLSAGLRQFRIFQFTPLREGRLQRAGGEARAGIISIHAPPRGATFYAGLGRRLIIDFNSRPSARGDNRLGKRGFFRAYFNSRPSARGDSCAGLGGGLCHISIHAPPRGATPSADQLTSIISHFNSRPSARGDARRTSRRTF